ncbi:hypothetical protein AOZ07_11500 [Glutamicibacter halophytocola]|uniref:hypothetical protein n=1 Tax=Glutamicibacter halophytocola TaxID=1933880 RepID=UPI0006D4A7E7|nr:hypothetical protein [Glutamicibacter halophytocola]ALG29543.1 hypothetical protein AOZ07_11500 [Glutamicibacter halophytocola]
MSTVTGDVVHHLYNRTGDLLPYCGAIPGPDHLTGDWNTGHDRDELLQCLNLGLVICMACASPEALSGFTPLILSEDG